MTVPRVGRQTPASRFPKVLSGFTSGRGTRLNGFLVAGNWEHPHLHLLLLLRGRRVLSSLSCLGVGLQKKKLEGW